MLPRQIWIELQKAIAIRNQSSNLSHFFLCFFANGFCKKIDPKFFNDELQLLVLAEVPFKEVEVTDDKPFLTISDSLPFSVSILR